MPSTTLFDLENEAGRRGYGIGVKVDAKGETTVTLSKVGATFLGDATFRSPNGYQTALQRAVNRMLAYENRHGNGK